MGSETPEQQLWDKQGSGLFVEPDLAERLEIIWKRARAHQGVVPPCPCLRTDAVQSLRNCQDVYDSLGVARQARTFATLLVAKRVLPPYALGLLGDWGVGKSQFMRLMQKEIAALAGKEADAESHADFVSRVAQIEFNAWHYVDSDLWASLASHIFDGLSQELCQKPDEVETVRRALRQRIRSSKSEQDEAQTAIDAAWEKRQIAASTLTSLQEDRTRAAAGCERYRLTRVWQAVLTVKPDKNREETKDWPDVEKLRAKAEETTKRLGITKAIDSAEEAQRVYASLRQLTKRSSGLAAALASEWTEGRAKHSAVIVVATLLAIVLGWPLLLKGAEHLLHLSEGTLTLLLSPLLELGTAVGLASGWAATRLNKISSALSYLETIREELRKPRVELRDPTSKECDLKKEIETLDTQIAEQQQKIKEADRTIADAQAEIERINAGGLVYDFLVGRVRDSRYLDRLGLISVIRRDFEQLHTLLRDWQKNATPGATPSAQPSSPGWDSRPIERIILYIDDLDRCPPKRVVQVLEAVHLLLAFPLFVVVVAVDARWLERSLNEVYNPWMTGKDGSDPTKPIHPFDAHNYLEKILQIPFSLPAMGESGYCQLVTDDMAEVEHAGAEQTQMQNPEAGSKGGEIPTPGSPATGKPAGPDEDAQRRQADALARRRQQKQKAALKRMAVMVPADWERQFISALYPFVKTPRLTRRLLNIYRLLRVRAMDIEDDFTTFVDRERGEYRAVLILLAIIIGRPAVAPEILDALYLAGDGDFLAWLKRLSTGYKKKESALQNRRLPGNKGTPMVHPRSSQEIRLAELHEGTKEILKCIDAVQETLRKTNGPALCNQLPSYTKWACEIGHYLLR